MGYYRGGISPAAPATAAPYCTLHAGASRIFQVWEVWASCATAVLSDVGIIRPANSPSASTSVLGQACNTADAAATVNMDTAWTTAPTISTNVYLEKVSVANVQGSFVPIFRAAKLEECIWVALSAYLVFWNYGSGTAAQVDFKFLWSE